MKHLVSALPRMALLAAAFVAVTAIWGAGTDPTRAEEHDRPGDRGPLSYVMSLAQPGQLPDADAPIAAGISELDGDRYTATLIGGEWAGTMSSPIIGTSSAGSFGAFNNHGRPQVIVSGNSRDGAAASVIELRDGHGRRYALEASGDLLKAWYFEADAAEATWSATAPLPKFAAESGSLWGNNLEIAELLRAAFSIEERERVYGGDAAVIAAPGAEQSRAPRQAAPDEGGTGVNNFDREEWYEFSILLAPFLVLVTFILILMFRWDRGSKEE